MDINGLQLLAPFSSASYADPHKNLLLIAHRPGCERPITPGGAYAYKSSSS